MLKSCATGKSMGTKSTNIQPASPPPSAGKRKNFMKCPSCGHEWKNQGNQAAGAIGGKVKNANKGFANPDVRARAIAAKRSKKENENEDCI